MKKLFIATLLLTAFAFAKPVWSATISGINNVTLLDSSGSVSASSNNSFITVSSTASTIASSSTLTEVLTDTDTNNFALATYALESNLNDPDSFIEIAFGDTVTGSNNLVFFFFGGNADPEGNTINNNFDLDINLDGIIDTSSATTTHFIPKDNGSATLLLDLDTYRNSGPLQTMNYYTLNAAIVDLSATGLAPNQNLDNFRVYLGDGSDHPLLAGVGYISAVPLPLPAVLFISGLGMLGVFARKKS